MSNSNLYKNESNGFLMFNEGIDNNKRVTGLLNEIRNIEKNALFPSGEEEQKRMMELSEKVFQISNDVLQGHEKIDEVLDFVYDKFLKDSVDLSAKYKQGSNSEIEAESTNDHLREWGRLNSQEKLKHLITNPEIFADFDLEQAAKEFELCKKIGLDPKDVNDKKTLEPFFKEINTLKESFDESEDKIEKEFQNNTKNVFGDEFKKLKMKHEKEKEERLENFNDKIDSVEETFVLDNMSDDIRSRMKMVLNDNPSHQQKFKSSNSLKLKNNI